MPAIVTTEQRIQNAKNFIDDFSGSPVPNYLYLWIAKTDPWNTDLNSSVDGTPDNPIGETFEQSKIYNDMIAMKRVEEANLVHSVPTFAWTSGVEYTAWDDNYRTSTVESGCSVINTIYDTVFYVITGSFNVYKCLVKGSGASTQQPTHTSIEPLEYPDGYVWHYMYTVSIDDALKFYNNSFFPVREKETQDPDQGDIEGGIFRIVVTDGGSGYTSPPTVTIEGNGTGANATAVITGDAVTSITIDVNIDNTLDHGTGYDYARVVITGGGGSGAKARAVLSPRGGHGYNPVSELGAYNVQVAVDIEATDDEDFVTSNDYRRIGLIKNPSAAGSPEVPATAVTINCLSHLKVSSVTGGTFSADDVITGSSSTAKAYVDEYRSGTPNRLFFHQNEKTGWTDFQVAESISVNTVSATIDSINESEYEPFTGDIIFIENRDPIIRTSSTREEIRMIVQF